MVKPESAISFVGLQEASVEKGVSLICIQRGFVESFFLQLARIDPRGKQHDTMRHQTGRRHPSVVFPAALS